MKVPFEELIGQTLTDIEHTEDELVFTTSDGVEYKMNHIQACCESVYLEDVNGDLSDLLNSPILRAEESSSEENPPDYTSSSYQDSFTWTFYKLSTIKGSVTLRWYGESNGYYSEAVDFYKEN